MVRVKICGVTTVEDALSCVAAGADAIGLNFFRGSPRYVSPEDAAAIVSALPERVVSVGVFVDASEDEIAACKLVSGIRCVQLHGDESPELVSRFLPHAYKALRVSGPEIHETLERYPGEHVLLDAFVPGVAGGTGHTFDWALAAEVARRRHLTLAGGLTPDNVALAVSRVRPFCVDVASGVERAPGRKDADKVRLFIARAKAA